MGSVINNILKNAIKSKLLPQQIRFYPRWSHRRPSKIYTPEEYEKIEKKSSQKTEENVFDKYGGLKTTWKRSDDGKGQENDAFKFKVRTEKTKKPLVATNQKSKVMSTDMLETVIDSDGNFIYTKMKNNDQRVGSILAEVKSKKEKEKKNLVLLEGKRLIKDALQSGCQLKYILFTRMNEIEYLKPFLPKVGAQLYKMPYKEMQMWSDVTTTPGIMAIFKTPNVEDFIPKEPIPLTVICDNIREPGNLGTALRICAAVGCSRVILTPGCVNLWDTKVLRSSTGAHFKLRINTNLNWKEIDDLLDQNSNLFIADNKLVADCSENHRDLDTVLEKIPILPYHSVDFQTSKHLVLIIGGETLGISRDSYEFALKLNGARLNIPLRNDVDSLNVGAALGIIAFEIKKQLNDF